MQIRKITRQEIRPDRRLLSRETVGRILKMLERSKPDLAHGKTIVYGR